MSQYANRQDIAYNLKHWTQGRIIKRSFCGITLTVLLLLLSGCSRKQNDFIYSVELGCGTFSSPIKLLVNGREKAVLSDCNDRNKVIQISGSQLEGKDIYAPGVLTAQVLYPEGWTDLSVNAYSSNLNLHRRQPQHEYVDLAFEDSRKRPNITLFIDNRDSSASEFSVGQLKMPMTTNDAYETWVPAPERDDAANLKINDTILGTLPTTRIAAVSSSNELPVGLRDASGQEQVFLLDVSGKRKYKRSCVGYGAPCGGTPTILKGQHLYQVGRIHDFLRPAPNTSRDPTRSELLDITNKK